MTSNIVTPGFESEPSYDVLRHGDDIDLLTLAARERALFDAGYRSGYGHGLERGRELRMEEESAAWQKMAARIRWVASQPLYSELCVRRSEHDRAEVARAQERRLGVAS